MNESSGSAQATQLSLEPIVKSMVVNLPLEAAFHLFTREIGSWWPLRSHSVGGDDAVECRFEEWVGGRFYEIDRDGSEYEWGRLLVWEPPQRVACTFYPGRTQDKATEVEVTFAPDGRQTRMTLTHRGWEKCSPDFQAERGRYVVGWDTVLSRYLAASEQGG
jgi:hypothetical protein